jgi:pyrimidine operon attenuation protein/uracil phosphoribosyltransferase
MAFQVPSSAQKILTRTDLERKINRMAYQLMELLYGKEEAVLIGIEDGGFQLAGLLAMKMQSIDNIRIELASIYVNKPAPYSEKPFIRYSTDGIKRKPVILVDDVGNSGSTLFHALSCIYPLQPQSLHVALLIDRTHKRFPIKADIVGLELATTLTEHIHVVFDEQGVPEGAYLF